MFLFIVMFSPLCCVSHKPSYFDIPCSFLVARLWIAIWYGIETNKGGLEAKLICTKNWAASFLRRFGSFLPESFFVVGGIFADISP
jgi:hypothetical protein